MAQPPDYGSYAKKEQKVFKLSRFIKNALLITLLIAVVEVVIIYFVTSKGKEQRKIASTIKPIEPRIQYKPIIVDTNKTILLDTIAVPTPDSQKAINHVVADTPKTIIPAIKDTIPKQKIAVIKEQKILTDTAKIIPIAKQLSISKMQSIMESIRKQKSKLNISSNCVQIRKTNSSNVTNAFKIAEYLKQNGFIIGGRLTVGGNVKGYTVKVNESCIELTIGSL